MQQAPHLAPDTRSIAVEGDRCLHVMHHRVPGPGVPTVFIHGGAMDHTNWDTVVAAGFWRARDIPCFTSSIPSSSITLGASSWPPERGLTTPLTK